MTNTPKTYTPQPLPPQGQMMQPGLMPPGLMPPGAVPPPPPMRKRPAPRGWRERWMRRFGMDTTVPLQKGALTLPDWLTGKAIVVFFVAMLACWLAFGHVPNFELWMAAVMSVVLFFYGGMAMSRRWRNTKEKTFARNLFVTGLTIRILWLLYVWFFFNTDHYGAPYGAQADVEWYMPFGMDLARWLVGDSSNTLSEIIKFNGSAIDDVGYPMWLAVGYVIWGDWSDAFMPMLIKCIASAYCAVCIYNIAKRHFEEGTARIAGFFVALNPNMIYWCGTMFKEAEMVFLVCLAVDNFDRVLSSGKKYTFRALLPGILASIALMFFRTALGLVIFLAMFAHIVMASERVMTVGKKVLAGVLVTAVLAVSMGDRIWTQTRELMEAAQSDKQEKNMEWRGKREGGNTFAKYAGVAVFAPLIFTIPFPTFNQANEHQLLQVQLSGGSYIKNILSFFVILVMFMMLISGEWRRHVFILAYTVGYHVVLAMSAFAQSGRFHMPVIPMLMLFGAYGIQIAKTNVKLRKWLPIALMIEVMACLAWNWFKLKGRGMI